MKRAPRWFILLCVLSVLTMGFTPALISASTPGSMLRFLAYCYPLYAIASAVMAYYCYRDRDEISWILLILSFMSGLLLLLPALLGTA